VESYPVSELGLSRVDICVENRIKHRVARIVR